MATQYEATVTLTFTSEDADDLNDFLEMTLETALERVAKAARTWEVDMAVNGAGAGVETQTDGVHIKGNVSGSMVNIGSGSQTFQTSKTNVEAGQGSHVETEQTHIVQNQSGGDGNLQIASAGTIHIRNR